MPAVAQINVNFANRQEFTESIPSGAGVTSVKSISPYTLLQYLLYDRESIDEDQRIKSPVDIEFYTYKGGVITAGDKINVKHSDFQITTNTDKPSLPGGNLDVENSIYVDSIYARRKGKGDSYRGDRGDLNRSVIISPRTDTATNNFFKIESAGTSRNISLFTLNNANLRNRIEIATAAANRNIILETDVLSISANDTFNTGNITVNNNATFNRNITMIGSDTASQEIFKITNSSGTDKFSVDSANGNTDIQGTLNVEGATEVDDTLRLTGAATFDSTLSINNNITLTNSAKANKRIIGIRRVDDADDIFDASNSRGFQNDPIAIGDFSQYAFQKGMIIMWSGELNEDGAGRLLKPTGGWALCRGHSVDGVPIPDLRERFIVGAGATGATQNTTNPIPTSTGGYALNARGGEQTVQLSEGQMPQHKHDVNVVVSAHDLDHTHTYTCWKITGSYTDIKGDGSNSAFNKTGGVTNCNTSGESPNLSNVTHDTSGTTEALKGSNQRHENRPPYYALAFIVKL